MRAFGPDLLFFILAVGAAAYLSWCGLREQRNLFRGRSGRPYADVVTDLFRETERRGDILAAWATARALRIDKVERRWAEIARRELGPFSGPI